jgi:regulation of enolase protein 1 (concanavalin A-like superfamily)
MTTIRSRRFAYVWLIALLSITVEVGPPAVAQAPLLPYATLRVVPDTHGQVWPADFNEDGITDLASGADDFIDLDSEEPIRIALGNGDGTFRPPVISQTIGGVRAVADLNRDGFIDVVALTPDGLAVLPGNGNGTLQAPRLVSLEAGWGGFVLAVDLNADGIRDIAAILSDGTTWNVAIYAGRGDFTFAEPVLVPTAALSEQATTGDFDGDGRLDIAVSHVVPATAPSASLTILLNEGLLQFTRSSVAVPKSASDVVARDLNGDGALDLVVSGSTYPGASYAHDGFVYVFTGGGNGSFALTATYPTAIGPIAIVVADFTRDGRLDVATANRSFRVVDTGCSFYDGADSVSILPGNGNGTFGAATTFALGSQQYGAEFFGNEVNSLNTSDLNRDGHTDLIVSDGRLLIAAAPRANGVPVVDAGEGLTEPGASTIFLRGGGTDPDGHLLTFRTTDASGQINHPSAIGCIDNLPAARYDLTMTATDGRAQASDTVVFDYAFKDPGPAGWTNGDIGAVAAAGSSLYNPQEQLFTVTGSGADIWDRADEFHFVSTPVSGDFAIYTRVESVENVNQWTKAGLMLREGTAPGSRHASIFVTPTTVKGMAFQRRREVNGLSVHTAGPAMTAPVWILLKRSGDLVSVYYQTGLDGNPWILIGRDVLPGLAATVNVGLAVSSHVDGRLATARFRDLLLLHGSGWVLTAGDIGAVGVPGDGNFSQTSGEMLGSGADIWGTADAFYFFRQWWTADATATVRIQSLQQTHAWAKMGLMFRETPAPGSRHVMLIVSAANGVAMQYRSDPGGISRNVVLSTGAAPEWLRLRRSGNTFTGYASEDGTTWRTIGAITLPLDLDTYVGVALTSHNNSTRASGVFDNLTVVR